MVQSEASSGLARAPVLIQETAFEGCGRRIRDACLQSLRDRSKNSPTLFSVHPRALCQMPESRNTGDRINKKRGRKK